MRDFLIPPKQKRNTPGTFQWPKRPTWATTSLRDRLPLNQLKNDLRIHQPGIQPRIQINAIGHAHLRIKRDTKISNPEGYRLNIRPEGIEVRASTHAGAYYAIQTLREMLHIHGNTIPCCRIEDAPDFQRRGIYFDCSRGKVPTIQTLETLIEYLGSIKINELQLYVENVFAFQTHPQIHKGFSPFTPEDILHLQDHCKKHHITFVPSLASFGHMERILALPQYAHLGEKPRAKGPRGGSTLCPTAPAALKLVADLYDEYLPLFETTEFNACCDETWELGEGRSKKRAKKIGKGKLYLDFVLQLRSLAEKHGKRLNIWADIVLSHPEILPQIPEDTILLNWEYAANGPNIRRTKEIAQANREFIVCPGTSGWQSHGTRLQNAIENVRNFARKGLKCGARGLLNTDWGDAGHRNPLGVSLHGFAHGAAHSWNTRKVQDAHFTETFAFHFLGDSTGEAAKAIRATGAVQDLLDEGHDSYGCRTFLLPGQALKTGKVLLKGLRPRSPIHIVGFPDYTNAATEKGAQNTFHILQNIKIPGQAPTPFAHAALQDYALAAEMDQIVCLRILAAKKLRNGKHPSPQEKRALIQRTRRILKQFEKNWTARNRPSRLKDNLRLLQNGLEDAQSL